MTKKILIIDDSPLFLNTLGELLVEEFFVETANSKEEAINLLDAAGYDSLGCHEPYDLIITDPMMPGLSGHDVSEYIKGKNRENKFTPILMLTGSDMTQEEARRCGCTTSLAKSNLKKVVSMARILLRS